MTSEAGFQELAWETNTHHLPLTGRAAQMMWKMGYQRLCFQLRFYGVISISAANISANLFLFSLVSPFYQHALPRRIKSLCHHQCCIGPWNRGKTQWIEDGNCACFLPWAEEGSFGSISTRLLSPRYFIPITKVMIDIFCSPKLTKGGPSLPFFGLGDPNVATKSENSCINTFYTFGRFDIMFFWFCFVGGRISRRKDLFISDDLSISILSFDRFVPFDFNFSIFYTEFYDRRDGSI